MLGSSFYSAESSGLPRLELRPAAAPHFASSRSNLNGQGGKKKMVVEGQRLLEIGGKGKDGRD